MITRILLHVHITVHMQIFEALNFWMAQIEDLHNLIFKDPCPSEISWVRSVPHDCTWYYVLLQAGFG